MNKYKIILQDGYTDGFNSAMRTLLSRLEGCKILEEPDEYTLIVESADVEIDEVISSLNDADCFIVNKA